MYKKILDIILLHFILLLCLACEKSEINELYYSNYAQLGITDEPGNWVPSFIPRSAKEIKVKYKIDTGAELLTFFYENDQNEILNDSLNGYCSKATIKDIEFPPQDFLEVDWWPNSLFSTHSKEKELPYKLYQCERQSFLAIKHVINGFQAYYWRVSIR